MTADSDANKPMISDMIVEGEALKDFYTPSMKHIKPLIQLDDKPDSNIKEARWDIYKISLSFPSTGELI